MAVLKHLASKNADYSQIMDYMLFQHDEFTMKPVLDENGRMVLREEYYIDGINCEPILFDKECEKLNAQYHKNQRYDDVKSHHYILRFAPRDKGDHGLTGERVQALGMEYAKKNFPGHQALAPIWMVITAAEISMYTSSILCGSWTWSHSPLWNVPVTAAPVINTI